jgi:predicted N-acyltransferase
MGLDVQVVNSVSQVDQTSWDELGERQAFSSYQWYQFGETVMDDCLPVYIIVSKNGIPVGRATFWVINNEPIPIPQNPFRGVIQRAAQSLLHAYPLFACRSPLSNMTGLVLPQTSEREEVLATIIQAAKKEAKSHSCSFILFDNLEREAYDFTWLPEAIKYVIPDPGSVLEITWRDYEDYLKSLTPKTRKNYRRYLRYADGENIAIRTLRGLDDKQMREASDLLANVDKRFQQIPSPWFVKMLRHFPLVGGTMLAAEMDGRMVGCELLLKDGDEQFVTALGLDYSVQNVYFLLGYADIRLAIEQGARRLHWGSGAFEAKERMGFEPEYNNHVVYLGVGKIAKWIGRLAAAF